MKGRCLLFGTFQLAQLAISVPFALIRYHFFPGYNVVGIEADLAWYGAGLVIYAVFNYVFLTGYYKTVKKIGVPVPAGAGARCWSSSWLWRSWLMYLPWRG